VRHERSQGRLSRCCRKCEDRVVMDAPKIGTGSKALKNVGLEHGKHGKRGHVRDRQADAVETGRKSVVPKEGLAKQQRPLVQQGTRLLEHQHAVNTLIVPGCDRQVQEKESARGCELSMSRVLRRGAGRPCRGTSQMPVIIHTAAGA